jgi:hypothetical protein
VPVQTVDATPSGIKQPSKVVFMNIFQVMNPPITSISIFLFVLIGAFSPSAVQVTSGNKEPVAIVVEVKDPGNGPIPGAKVELISVESATAKTLEMDQYGSARAELQPGDYDAIVAMRAFGTLSRRVSVSGGQKLQFVLQMDACPPGCVEVAPPDRNKFVDATVVVLDQSGALIPNAQIRLMPDTLVRIPNNPKTDQRGELHVLVIPGVYYLFAAEPAFSPVEKTIEVKAGPDQIFSLFLHIAESTSTVFVGRPNFPVDSQGISSYRSPSVASAQISIFVTNSKGIPIPFAQIDALGPSLSGIAQGVLEADEHGKLDFKILPGEYKLVVTSPAYKRWTKEIQIREGENRGIRVLLADLDF